MNRPAKMEEPAEAAPAGLGPARSTRCITAAWAWPSGDARPTTAGPGTALPPPAPTRSGTTRGSGRASLDEEDLLPAARALERGHDRAQAQEARGGPRRRLPGVARTGPIGGSVCRARGLLRVEARGASISLGSRPPASAGSSREDLIPGDEASPPGVPEIVPPGHGRLGPARRRRHRGPAGRCRRRSATATSAELMH